MRVAISGIPSSQLRYLTGPSPSKGTLYREVAPRVHNEGAVRHEIKRIQNTGNYLIGEGAHTALIENDVQFIPFNWLSTDDWIDYINKNFDFFVFTTANIFHIRNNPAEETRVFDRLKVPILMMSSGIQKREHFSDTVPEHFVPFIDVLKRKGVHVFTRGTPTAEFLRGQGVAYVEPVGCPSLFAFPDNVRDSIQRLKALDVRKDLDILYSGYLGSVKDSVHDVNQLSKPGTKARYAIQDEPLLFRYEFDAPEGSRIYNDTSGRIMCPVKYPFQEELKVPLDQYVFFSTTIWRAFAAEADLAMARRFHGGLIAAQSGQPTFWVAVDDRTSEMLQFAGLPHVQASDWNRAGNKLDFLARYIDTMDVRAVLRTYNERLERFRSLLSDLGLRR